MDSKIANYANIIEVWPLSLKLVLFYCIGIVRYYGLLLFRVETESHFHYSWLQNNSLKLFMVKQNTMDTSKGAWRRQRPLGRYMGIRCSHWLEKQIRNWLENWNEGHLPAKRHLAPPGPFTGIDYTTFGCTYYLFD